MQDGTAQVSRDGAEKTETVSTAATITLEDREAHSSNRISATDLVMNPSVGLPAGNTRVQSCTMSRKRDHLEKFCMLLLRVKQHTKSFLT